MDDNKEVEDFQDPGQGTGLTYISGRFVLPG